jgi:anti-sigma regulatory factor (Ser/Thr protein kinase)
LIVARARRIVRRMVARRFPREYASLEAIYGFLREFLALHGLDAEVAYDLDLVAEELFTNMVKYGRGGGSEIELALDWNAPELLLRLSDFGVERFDPTSAPEVDVNRPIEQRRAGGLGIHLIRQIADRFEYAHEAGNSIVTITKRLSA